MTILTWKELGKPSQLTAKEDRASANTDSPGEHKGGGDRNWSLKGLLSPCDKLLNANLDYSISLKSLCPEILQLAVHQFSSGATFEPQTPAKTVLAPIFLLLTSSPWAQI